MTCEGDCHTTEEEGRTEHKLIKATEWSMSMPSVSYLSISTYAYNEKKSPIKYARGVSGYGLGKL